ncbi:MAG: hypothetical protein LBO09_05485 [Candidatus Peribacteria bacterium]|jgi:hypothetical protein|nr:hypothetical protein [Candidatus Peribacteria bacterium]
MEQNENGEALRPLTKKEQKTLDSYDIPYDIKAKVVEHWRSKEEPQVKSTKKSVSILLAGFILNILTLLLCIVLWVKYLGLDISFLTENPKLVDAICKLGIFGVWITMGILLLVAILTFSMAVVSGTSPKFSVLDNGYLVFFKKKSLFKKICNWSYSLTLLIALVLNAFYGTAMVYVLISGIWYFFIAVFKDFVKKEFDEILNPKDIIQRSGFMQRLEEAQRKQKENLSQK